MAFDEALLEEAAAERVATLRFYEWAEPTLSLGYFQAAADRGKHPASLDCPLVRRSSGGGAILHDRELTYSVTWPVERQLGAEADRLSAAIHEALIAALAELGVTARLCEQSSGAEIGEQPFLCFARRAVGDLLVGRSKIAGSAQRRRRGAILQHGSVLLASSPFAPELPGLVELTGRAILPESLAEVFQQALGDRFKRMWIRSAASGQIGQRTVTLLAERFASPAWTLRR